jgi:uncharacterized protein YggU (UPF0235/DUF167 family)
MLEAIATVIVTPRAAHARIWLAGGFLRVAVHSSPVDGEANGEVIFALSKRLRIAPSRIRIASGGKSRNKRIAFQGITQEELERRIVECIL